MRHKKRKLAAFVLPAITAVSLLTGNIQAYAAFPVSTAAQGGENVDTQEPEIPDTQDSEVPGMQESEIPGTQNSEAPGMQEPEAPGTQDSVLSGDMADPAPSDTMPHTKATSGGQHGVTFDTTQDYVHNIYANGEPLLIVASETDVQYARLYVDSNRNGIGEAEEEVLDFQGLGTLDGGGIFYSPGNGYFLTNSYIYGGSRDGSCQYDTSVILTGNTSTDPDSLFTTRMLSGGSKNGTLTGNTSVIITGGSPRQVYGGNEDGTLNGSTNIQIAGGTSVWTYGGCRSGTLNGNTNIHVTGGYTVNNIYGGNAFGQVNGNTNILMEAGEAFHLYGGGEMTSSVSGTASVAVNGGYINTLFASGAGFDGTKAETEAAEISLKGGNISMFSACPSNQNMKGTINGALSLELSGDSFAYTGFFFGTEANPVPLKKVSAMLQEGKISSLSFWSPVRESLSVAFENASATSIMLADGVLADAQSSSLSFRDCGQADGSWSTNPYLTVSELHKNKFDTMTFKDSYINYSDDTETDGENGPSFCSGKLVLDGGALRVIGTDGNLVSYMPKTEFANNPLLIRTAYHEGLNFAEIPDGAARIQWMDRSGADISESMKDAIFAETPSDTPDTLFTPADSRHTLKTDIVTRGDSSGERWRGKAWYIATDADFCICQAYSTSLEENIFPLPNGTPQMSAVLKPLPVSAGSPVPVCPVVGHKDSEAAFSYTVIPEGTTARGASIDGNRLTASGTGQIHISVMQTLNGKSFPYDTYVQILGVPKEDRFTFTENMTEDIILTFYGAGFDLDGSSLLYVPHNKYSKELSDGSITFTIGKEVLDTIGIMEYGFRAHVCTSLPDGSNQSSIYNFDFTANIVPPKEVTNPVIELSQTAYHYDGTAKTPAVAVKDGDAIISSDEYTVSYENNINTGIASVRITDKPGGHYIVNGTAEFEIVNTYRPEDGTDYTTTLNNEGWTNGDFIVTAKDGYLLSTGNTLADSWAESLRRTTETAGDTLDFYVKNISTGEISLCESKPFKIDKTSPGQYDIAYNENSVKKLLHEVSFGLLFNKNIDVTITAEDALSGIGSISYYLSETVLTEEQVKEIRDWKNGEAFRITAEDEERFIVYAKVADRAGNVVCFASDGAEFDLTPPQITGVTDSIFYTTQIAVVTDKNPYTVSLNGQPVTGDITLPGNREAVYIIKATDQTGNETSVTVTMKPIQSLADSINGITEDNITSADRKTLISILAVDTSNATQAEREELLEITDACSRLLAVLDDIHDELSQALHPTDGITKDTVKLSDEEALKETAITLGNILEDHDNNFTEEEIQEIQENLTRITEALESIARAQKTESLILALPNADTVSPDDLATETAAKEAKETYDALSEHEKTLVDAEKLTQVLAALTDYKILEGDKSVWKKETDGGITLRANGSVTKFTGILIDGKPVDERNYTVKEGSTIVALKRDYLDTLSPGEHSLTFLYTDGDASATFNIQTEESGNNGNTGTGVNTGTGENTGTNEGGNRSTAASQSAATGDHTVIFLWILLLLLTGGFAATVIYNRRKQNQVRAV